MPVPDLSHSAHSTVHHHDTGDHSHSHSTTHSLTTDGYSTGSSLTTGHATLSGSAKLWDTHGHTVLTGAAKLGNTHAVPSSPSTTVTFTPSGSGAIGNHGSYLQVGGDVGASHTFQNGTTASAHIFADKLFTSNGNGPTHYGAMAGLDIPLG